QPHGEHDLNYNHRERLQYRDWMFWSGTGLTHDYGAHHTPQLTYRRSFWLAQGLTDATGPEVRPGGIGFPRQFHGNEYSLDYQAQLLLQISESVRVSLNTITRPLGTSCTNGNAAVGTTFDIVPEHTGPSAISPVACTEVQQEIE